jgi:hypothetical protein
MQLPPHDAVAAAAAALPSGALSSLLQLQGQ